MTTTDFLQLTPRQQHVMVVAMYLRNAMEDFHVQNLSDAQMKELNQLIRRALNTIVSILETDESDRDRSATIGYLISQIPDYWEIPQDEPWR